MAKRKQLRPEEVRLTEPGPVDEQLYTVGEWSGLPQYVCKFCGFDSMREAAMRDHIDTHFPSSQPLTEPGKIQTDEQLIGVYEINLEEVLNDATSNSD